MRMSEGMCVMDARFTFLPTSDLRDKRFDGVATESSILGTCFTNSTLVALWFSEERRSVVNLGCLQTFP